MSDRLAVFNHGRIEQVGEPHTIYEHPETPFVAGFVGVTNLVSGDMAQRICGSRRTFSLRPEKIRLAAMGTQAGDTRYAVPGHIRDVVYLGLYTRYLVELDGGGDLVVAEQNLETSAAHVHQARGQAVCLTWQKDDARWLEADAEEAAHVQEEITGEA